MFHYARREFEKRYDSKLEIFNAKKKDDSPFDDKKYQSIAKDIPCRISKKSLPVAKKGDVSSIEYAPVLYCAPEVEILPGSKLIVTNMYGNSREYKYTGESMDSYHTHQEVPLLRSEKA